jgi:hypothetical protein
MLRAIAQGPTTIIEDDAPNDFGIMGSLNFGASTLMQMAK